MHVSRIITYPPFNAAYLEDNHIVAHALNVERHVPNRTEIMVPTCSYRMGVAKMGYGWAILGMFLFFYVFMTKKSVFDLHSFFLFNPSLLFSCITLSYEFYIFFFVTSVCVFLFDCTFRLMKYALCGQLANL